MVMVKNVSRWRLIVGGVLAVVMLLGLATPALAAVTDVFYGIRDNGWIDSYDPVAGTTTPLIDVVPPVLDTSTSGPNGLGYCELTNRLYYTEYPDANGDGKANIYFTDLDDSTPSVTYAGQLPGLISDADIYNGVYFYIHHGTDDFYAVTFNADGTVATVSSKIDLSGNVHGWTFDGDVAIWEGVLYGWGRCTAHGRYEFFSANLDGSGLTIMDNTLLTDVGSVALQLAFASDGTLYGHNYGTGRTYKVSWDAAGNVTATFLRVSTFKYTDTASGSTGSDLGYSLTGSKWYDRDKDRVWDDDEPGIEGWKVYLYEGEPNIADPGAIDWVQAGDTLTIADGSYSFNELEPGLYKVVEGDPSGCWMQTFPTTGWYEREIVDSGFEGLDFGNVCEGMSTGGFTIGYWSNKNGAAALAAYNIGEDDVNAWQTFLDEYNLVDKVGEDYDPSIDGAFRTWLLKADATNMSYMLSVQLAATLLNIEVKGTDYIGYGVLLNGDWKSIDALIDEANAFLLEHPVTLADDPARDQAEVYKNLFDALNNNAQVLIPYDPCPVPTW
jgi:YD repeat-containing protein